MSKRKYIKDNIIKLYHELTYFKNNKIGNVMDSFLDSESSKILLKNAEFKNCHQGQRCFILGNGPSLKTENLACLQSEIVFTVNQAPRINDFAKLNTNYHFWADESFFKRIDDQGADELLSVMQNVNTEENKPIVFFPINQKKFVIQHGLDKTLNTRYFKNGVQMYDGFNHVMDFSKRCMSFGTVVQWCISMAIYMGFKEIYLMGCDNTALLVTIKSALKQNDDNDYSYHVTKNEKVRMEKLLDYHSLEDYTLSWLVNMQQYRYLFDYCQKRDITLVNCSSTTVIDCIPRKRLTDVL